MTPLVLISLIIIAPVLILTALRINAAIVFLSLCLGSVLVRFVSDDAHSFVSLFASNKTVSDSYVSIGLLLLPVVFTMLVMIATVRGKIKTGLNILPALSVGVVGLLLAEPLFSPGLRGAISNTILWHDLVRAQSLAVGVSTLISLLFLWFLRPKHGGHEEGKHHRR